MKKRYLGLLVFAASLVMASCGGNNNPPASSEESSSSLPSSESSAPSSESSAPSSETSAPSSESSASSESSESQETIDHIAAYTKGVAEGTIERSYNKKFDTMIDDFSGETINGTTTGTVDKPVLRAIVDSANGDYPNSPDAAIYKTAAEGGFAKYDGIGFRIRVLRGKLPLSALVLGLRGDDQHAVYPISLADASNPDGEALPELTSEFQDIVVSPNMTLEGNAVYNLPDGTASDLKVLDGYLGFHLYSVATEVAAEIEIESIFGVKAGEKTVIDGFARAAVNDANGECWWRDSVGYIRQKGITLGDYKTPVMNEDTHLVLNALGDASGLTIAPVTASGVGTPIAYSELKGNAETGTSALATGAYHPIAIDLVSSGLKAEGVTGYALASTTPVSVSAIYSSSLREEVAAGYPSLDPASYASFDDFNVVQNRIDNDYSASVANELVTSRNLNFSVTYTNQDDVKVNGTGLEFSATEGYSQVVEGSKTSGAGYEYLIFSMKLGEGATLDNFRVRVKDGGSVLYANDWLAGAGLKSIPADLTSYDYVEGDYVWYILSASAMEVTFSDYIDMYYTGAGTLTIDSIFFANSLGSYVEAASTGAAGTYSAVEWAYCWGGANYVGYDGVMLEIEGDGVANFSTYRLGFADDLRFGNNGLIIRDAEGKVIDNTAVIPTEAAKYVIEFAENTMTPVAGNLDMHWGGWGEGSVKVNSIHKITKKGALLDGDFVGEKTAGAGAYNYLGYACNAYLASKIMLTVYSPNESTIEFLTIQTGTSYLNLGSDAAKVTTLDGEPYDTHGKLPKEAGDAITIVVDLKASGATVGKDTHFHGNNEAFTTDAQIIVSGVSGTSYDAASVVAAHTQLTPSAE